MENRSHALLAGLFLLILGASALAALWWFSGLQEESSHYLIETRNNVTGLNAQAQVRYRGIRVGRVESIRLDPADARATLIGISIPRSIPITRGTIAKLGHQGVTGIAHILLEDDGADATPFPGGGEGARIAMRDSLMQELTDTGGEALRQARDLLAGMNDLLRPENRQSLSRTLANIEASSLHARETSERLRQALDPETMRRVGAILAHSERTVAQAAPFFAEARGLVARLNTASEKFETALGDANLGGVSALTQRLNGLTGEFASTTQHLNRVLRMLEESPQSLIFGRQANAPGPGERGFMPPPGGDAP
ncbi:MAG: MlaD family protein [Candidatus Accumulibacter sp.]|jgi:phospholipid/cholesterol/gamma-HCH transport system substrate-binding protein|nr:MlaD family protein [Accumulibacter sp.]